MVGFSLHNASMSVFSFRFIVAAVTSLKMENMSDRESLHSCDQSSAVSYEFHQVLFRLTNKFKIQIDFCSTYSYKFGGEK